MTPAQSVELLELAERCEAATGPDDDLDVAIDVALGGKGGLPPKHRWNSTPNFTASLDAAMTLVPEGQDCSLWWGMRGGNVTATAEIDGAAVAIAATPALALCAASLRAKAQPGDAE